MIGGNANNRKRNVEYTCPFLQPSKAQKNAAKKDDEDVAAAKKDGKLRKGGEAISERLRLDSCYER